MSSTLTGASNIHEDVDVTEFGVLNTKTNKMHRIGMSEGQVDSLLKVHHDDMESDKKKPYLIKVHRTTSEWQK